MPSQLQEIEAVFLRERMRFPNGDDEPATIIGDIRLLKDDSQPNQEGGNKNLPLAVKGAAEDGELQSQLSYRFWGRWQKYRNKRTGREELQFNFSTFLRAEPHGRAGVIAYLRMAGKGRGIGSIFAERIFDKFGAQSIRILKESPEVVSHSIKGISLDSATNVAEWLKSEEKTEGITIDLVNLLEGRGFPKATIKEAMREWGNHAADIIRRNPYQIMNFRGCGFKRADAMYLDLGKDPKSLKRQALAAWYAVACDSNGHTWLPLGAGLNGIKSMISGADVQPGKAMVLAKRSKMLSIQRTESLNGPLNSDPKIGTSIWVAESPKANREDQLARLVARKATRRTAWPSLEKLKSRGLTEHQIEQVLQATCAELGMLVGGPGTGKTTVLAALVGLLVDTFGANEIGVCAPTNKAAHRCTQAMHDKGVPVKATSIHSMLGVEKAKAGGWTFKHDESMPLPFRVLIIDEGSMVDTPLMASVFAAVGTGTLVLIVGDINQLPPIGHGAPMRDLLACGIVPVGELVETHRSAGRVVEACGYIAQGKSFQESETLNPKGLPPENFKIIEAAGGGRQIERMMQVIDRAKELDLDPIWDVQPLVALNEKGEVSRKEINRLLQRELNPSGFTIPGNPFREGDKVVCRTNDFYPLVGRYGEDGEESKSFVANGEFGRVTGVNEKSIIVLFPSPEREVVLPIGKQETEEESGGERHLEKSSKRPVELGYGSTVHFFQGSEVAIGLPMLDTSPAAKMVCSREWFFTAISRGKFLSLPIGTRATAMQFVKRPTLHKRKTFLRELILQYANEGVSIQREDFAHVG